MPQPAPPAQQPWDEWSSGLFVYSPYGEPMVGSARLYVDVLGQVAAAISGLRPEGVGSSASDWYADTFLMVQVAQTRLIGVVDQRADTGDFSVELDLELPAEMASLLVCLEDYSPAVVFSALASAAADWELEPATEERLAEIYCDDEEDLAAACEALAESGSWAPVEWEI